MKTPPPQLPAKGKVPKLPEHEVAEWVFRHNLDMPHKGEARDAYEDAATGAYAKSLQLTGLLAKGKRP